VRASATSRLAPPAGFHAARADSNAPKTDEASPFALLVGAAVAPAPKPSNTPGNASGGKGDDKPDDSKADQANAAQTAQTQTIQTQAAAPAGDSQPSQPANDTDQDQDVQAPAYPNATPNLPQADLNAAPLPQVTGDTQPVSDAGGDIASDADHVSLWPQSTRPQPQIGQAGKPVKADKTDKDDKKDMGDQPAQPDVAPVVTTDLPPPELQVAALTPPLAPQTIVPPLTDAPDQTQIAAAPAIAPTLAPANRPAAPPGQPTGPIAPQDAPQTADQNAPQAAAETAPQAAGPVAPQSQALAAGTPTAQQPPPKAASFAPATLAAAVNAQPGQDDAGQPQIEPPKDGPAIAPAKNQPKPAAAKANDAVKTSKPLPGKSQQVNDPAAVKGADANATADDTDDKPDTVKSAAPATDAAAPKVAANIANTIIPPAGQPGLPQTQGPDFTQHIQVTAQPHDTAPNLPALAVEIAAKSQSGAKQFDIRLDPPELGRVEVRLSIDATGKASAHLSADQPQTLSLLQKDASVLTRALRDAGLDVSQNGLNFSLRQQSGQDSGAGANAGRRAGRGLSLTATISIEATAAGAAYSGPADGRLDIRV